MNQREEARKRKIEKIKELKRLHDEMMQAIKEVEGYSKRNQPKRKAV